MNVTSVSFHSEGKWLVTGSEDGTIKIWDLRFVFTHDALRYASAVSFLLQEPAAAPELR